MFIVRPAPAGFRYCSSAPLTANLRRAAPSAPPPSPRRARAPRRQPEFGRARRRDGAAADRCQPRLCRSPTALAHRPAGHPVTLAPIGNARCGGPTGSYSRPHGGGGAGVMRGRILLLAAILLVAGSGWAGLQAAGSGNPRNDRLLALPPARQAQALGNSFHRGCIGVSAFPMGVTSDRQGQGHRLLERALQERQELCRADRARHQRCGGRSRLPGAARHRPGMLQEVLSSGAGARFTSAAAAGTPNTTGLDSVRANAGRRSFSEPSPPIWSSPRAAGATTPSTPPGLRPSGSGFPISPVPSLVSRPDRDRRAAILSPGARDRQLDCPHRNCGD